MAILTQTASIPALRRRPRNDSLQQRCFEHVVESVGVEVHFDAGVSGETPTQKTILPAEFARIVTDGHLNPNSGRYT